MQADIRPPIPDPGFEPDHHALAAARRQAKLRELAEEAQRLHLECKRTLVVHQAASERMALAIEEARARLVQVRASAKPLIATPPR